MSALVVGVATVILVVITAWYAHITNKMLESQRSATLRELEPLLTLQAAVYIPPLRLELVILNSGKGLALVTHYDFVSHKDCVHVDSPYLIRGQTEVSTMLAVDLLYPLNPGDEFSIRLDYKNAFGREISSRTAYIYRNGVLDQFGEVQIDNSEVYSGLFANHVRSNHKSRGRPNNE
jgi:hypothetical protein